MNLSKFLVVVSLIFFTELQIVQAIDIPPVQEPQNSVLVATVDVKNAKIISQEGNNFTLAFDLINKTKLQTGVRYGVQLVSSGGSYIADEKVYDESFTLYENSTLKKEIKYSAPNSLGGTYQLILVAKNESGFFFGFDILGEVKLVASTKGVQILNESCFFQIDGDKNNTHYPLQRSIDIDKEDSIKLTCEAINNTDDRLSLTPFFETRYYSAFGAIAPQIGGGYGAISFTPHEKKVFSLVLPKGVKPQFYVVKIILTNANSNSNSVSISYIVRGIVAMIQQASLDKDYYRAGDVGTLSIIWSASRGNLSKSYSDPKDIPAVSLKVEIKNEKGDLCATIEPIKQVLSFESKSPVTNIPFTVKTACRNPQVVATVLDSEGGVLDKKDFSFTTSAENVPQPLSKQTIFIVGVVLVVISGFGVYLKKKKQPILE